MLFATIDQQCVLIDEARILQLSMNQATKILFHSYNRLSHCQDGFAAAYCAWTVLGDSAEYIPVVHHEPPPPINPGDIIYLVDFSYPRSIMEQIIDVAEKVVVLDHHQTAVEQLLGIKGAILDMSKSGAVLAWEYWHLSQSPPELIRYISDRDLWTKELPYTEEIHWALSTFPQDFVIWDTLAKLPNYVEFMRRIGAPLKLKREDQLQQLVNTAKIEVVAGYQVPVIRTKKNDLVSDACNLLCRKYPDKPFAANSYKRNQIERWSLRSIGDFDVSQLAAQFGGGGHKNAAGLAIELNDKAH